MNVLLVLGVLGGLVAGLHPLRHRLGPEGTRKTLHALMGCGLVGLPLLEPSRGLLWILTITAIAALGALRCVPVLRRRWGGVLHDVQRQSWGELCYPAAVLVAIEGAPSFRVYAAALLTLALADTAAALAGQRWPWGAFRALGGGKTGAGSTACFVASAAVCVPLLGGATGLAVALVVTTAEAASGRGLDNLTVPAAVLLTVLSPGASLVVAGCVVVGLAWWQRPARQSCAHMRRRGGTTRRGGSVSHRKSRPRRRLASAPPAIYADALINPA